MQADVTRQTFGAIIVQFVLFALLFLASSIYGDGVPATADGDVFIPGNLLNRYGAAYPFAAAGLSLLLVFVIAFVITRTLSRNLIYPTRTYLPCLFYLLISCGIRFPAYDPAAVLAAYLIVCATVAFISSFVRTVSFSFTFRGAFLIGLTPLLEPQNAVYILLVPVAMLVFRRCARETTVAVLGSLLPSLFAAYIYWVAGYGFTGVYTSVWQGLVTPQAGSVDMLATDIQGIARLALAGLTAGLLILSAISFLTMASDMRTRAYKVQVFALWFLVIAAGSLALPSRGPGNMAVFAVPASVMAPAFFIRFRGAVPAVIYIVVCAAFAAVNMLVFFQV